MAAQALWTTDNGRSILELLPPMRLEGETIRPVRVKIEGRGGEYVEYLCSWCGQGTYVSLESSRFCTLCRRHPRKMCEGCGLPRPMFLTKIKGENAERCHACIERVKLKVREDIAKITRTLAPGEVLPTARTRFVPDGGITTVTNVGMGIFPSRSNRED